MAMWFALLKWLFGSWWSLPPNTPTRLRATVNTSTIRINWDCPTSSKWNSDSFELQMEPLSPELRRLLGENVDFITTYEGPQSSHVIRKLPPERALKLRVRCKNARGESAWSEEIRASTLQMPTRCGGKGMRYEWDQTPRAVDVRIRLDSKPQTKEVKVVVKPFFISVSVGSEAPLLEGKLFSEVRCQDMGDYSWEFEQRKEPTGSDDKDESANPRWVILLELRKRDEVFEPSRQWPCLIDADGHAKIDLDKMKWVRGEDWRPPNAPTTRSEMLQALPDMKFQDEIEEVEPDKDWGKHWLKNKNL